MDPCWCYKIILNLFAPPDVQFNTTLFGICKSRLNVIVEMVVRI
jgi:hypothetical protein